MSRRASASVFPVIRTNKGFALDPVAWNAARHGTLESPSRSVVATNKMRARCAHGARIIFSKTLTGANALRLMWVAEILILH